MADYGLVKTEPQNLKKGDYYRIERFFIQRTGKKQQHYTLYRYAAACLFGYWFRKSYQFKQNLGFNADEAMKKARAIIGSAPYEFCDTPRPVFDTMEAYGIAFKKGRNCLYGVPTKEFWDAWKTDKDTIKKQGFWVSKNDNGFMVFFKPAVKWEG